MGRQVRIWTFSGVVWIQIDEQSRFIEQATPGLFAALRDGLNITVDNKYSLNAHVTSLDIEMQTHYDEPGTCVPAIRFESHREGNQSSPHAIAASLARARMTVV